MRAWRRGQLLKLPDCESGAEQDSAPPVAGFAWTRREGQAVPLQPPVSDMMSTVDKNDASLALQEAGDAVRQAINLSRRDQKGEALKAYRRLFGDLFPLSE